MEAGLGTITVVQVRNDVGVERGDVYGGQWVTDGFNVEVMEKKKETKDETKLNLKLGQTNE